MKASALSTFAFMMAFGLLLSGATPALAVVAPLVHRQLLAPPVPPEPLRPYSPAGVRAASSTLTIVNLGGRSAVAGRMVVGFADGISAGAKSDVHAKIGQRLNSRRAMSPNGAVELIDVDASTPLESILQSYRADGRVKFAEPDYVVRASDTTNDPYLSLQWGLAKIAAPAAWSITHGSASVSVAILDCGIFDELSGFTGVGEPLPGHPDLRGKVGAARDFVGSPFGTMDLCGHGTHVAGIVAASANNSVGVAGVGYNTRLLNGKVLDDTGMGSDSSVSSGIYWATDSGAQVINLSLGGPGQCPMALQAAVDYAWSHNVVTIAAAGNAGNTVANAPADCFHVISVAATDSIDARVSSSSYGSWVNVAAPGSEVLSTYADASGYGYAYLSGTSMAAPHASGVAALVWATDLNASAQSVVDRVTTGADPIPGTGSLWQSGRINAAAAVAPPSTATTFEDTSPDVAFIGSWASWSDAGNSGGTAKYTNQSGAAATLGFTGTSVQLVFVKQPNAGIATVSIDGAIVDQLDTYSASRSFRQSKTYAVLAGIHTVNFAVSGNKNAASTDTYLIFDAFVAVAPPTSVATFEDSSAEVTFSGSWASWSDAGNSGGTAKYTNQSSANATFGFAGTFVRVVFVKQPNAGIATVTIDGAIVDQLDTYAAIRTFQQTKSYTVPPGPHSIILAVSGNKNAASADTYLIFDAFVSAVAPPPSATTFEDSSPQVSFIGSWASWSDAGNSGGSAKYTNANGASATLAFTGTSVQVVFVKQPNAGTATIVIDGFIADQLDTYAASRAFRQSKTYTVAAGSHTINFVVSGTRNAASTGTYLIFDAFVAAAAAPPSSGTTFEDGSPQVAYTGTWTNWSDAGNSGGSAKYTKANGASAIFGFTGTFVKVVFVKQPNAGIATVTIDGIVVDQLDTYAASRAFQQSKTYNVAAGNHNINFAVSGNKNAASTDTHLVFDAFVAAAVAPPPPGAIFEDGSAQVAFSGGWANWSDSGNSGGSAKYSNTVGASVSFTYAGTALTIVFVKQPNAGIATVTIDGGVVVDQLDTYSVNRAQRQEKLYTLEATGTHSVTVTVSGAKNAASADAYLIIDAFVVGGQGLFLNGQLGDPFAYGQSRSEASEWAVFYVTVRELGSWLDFNIHRPDYSQWWFVDIAAPPGQALAVGTYENAVRTAFRPPGSPGIDVSGNGIGCNTTTGRFVVDRIEFTASGSLLHFHATFEQHCDGIVPALFGEVTY